MGEIIFYSNSEGWECGTDDPAWARRLEALGAAKVRSHRGWHTYALRDDQLLIRKGKRRLSDDSKAKMARSLRQGEKFPAPSGGK